MSRGLGLALAAVKASRSERRSSGPRRGPALEASAAPVFLLATVLRAWRAGADGWALPRVGYLPPGGGVSGPH